MNNFSPEELRRAAVALDIIERLGDPDQWSTILCGASATSPTLGQSLRAGLLASELAKLLGEDRDRCEQAAAEAFAPSRHRAVFDALIGYADELAGTPATTTTTTRAPRPTVRIVADRTVTA
jgi:hypothetical protein